MAAYPEKEAMITDVAVPLTKLPDMMTLTRELLNNSSFKESSPIVAHAGDGNSHVLLFFDPKKSIEVKEAKKIAELLVSF